MLIEIDRVGTTPKHIDTLIPPGEIDLDDEDIDLRGDVSFRGEAVKEGERVKIAGTVAFAAEIDCTRCLKPIPRSFLFNFDVSYVRPEYFGTAREKEVTGEDLSDDIAEFNVIDLTEVVREQILLQLPEKELCDKECKGLCPKCGSDRNLIDCNCEDEELDPRWLALKDLK